MRRMIEVVGSEQCLGGKPALALMDGMDCLELHGVLLRPSGKVAGRFTPPRVLACSARQFRDRPLWEAHRTPVLGGVSLASPSLSRCPVEAVACWPDPDPHRWHTPKRRR